MLLCALCAAAVFGTAGCSLFQAYPARVQYPVSAFVAGRYNEAAAALEKVSPARGDRLCYMLERGTVRHTMGDYDASNEHFLEAVEVMREFDERAVVSLRDSAAFGASLLINDKARPYRGSHFERVLLHTYLAMNFLLKRDLTGARVEIRQAYQQQKEAREEHLERIRKTRKEAEKKKLDTARILTQLQKTYADQKKLLKKAGNIYQNVFTYYLSALVYELNGEINDAYIDVKTVYSLNPNFLPARRDLLRYAAKLGFRGDYARWRREFGDDLEEAIPKGHGDLVLLYQCGMAPVKREIKISIPVPAKDHFNLVPVAFPKYSLRPNPVRGARLLVDGRSVGTTCPLMDVEATAVRDLWDQVPGIALRQALRAAGRYGLTEYVKRELGEAFSNVLTVLGCVAEQADLRSWTTLPQSFQVLRVSIPAGTHKVQMQLLAGRMARAVTLQDVPVREKGITVVSLRSTGNLGTARYVAY